MATLKEHQAAMVDLLANGSGIPAAASRLAHAMHDVLSAVLLNAPLSPVDNQGRAQETTPGLNDKALSKREKALKTDSPTKWPTPAEQRVKELENTIRQLKANNRALRQEVGALRNTLEFADGVTTEKQFMAEQAGCRKEDTQCNHAWKDTGRELYCKYCGAHPSDLPESEIGVEE
ncbi:TPA: hypothetical protein LTY94_004590 [Salmonella enterica subsp. enterica serovar Typhimurium]|nr:hypothetical protein [Salmonella enterica subsp. enterica serovar Newport]EEB3074804.1 hypothetical protein [Salmonella enterica subsp. enterica serovar Typhimurium]HBL5117272.1 hypothetical protein [Salmonella enterica subsp. enterica serovar Typhimurium]HBL5549842.1 hypothetical protein [Salmonella enterica subsp. enterica serovar Typhimurium]HBL5554746.1 hypothetical protein [Salmonella enterica subsp. enterica serovar Typhimurium]